MSRAAPVLLFIFRLFLAVIALLAAFMAIIVLIGLFVGLAGGEKFAGAEHWVGFVLLPAGLTALSVLFFYLFFRLGRTQHGWERELNPELATVDVICPACRAGGLFRGPANANGLLQFRYKARCLTCGERMGVARDVWRRLPRPELGDPYETFEDKQYLVTRYPMTAGHAVCTALGLAVGIALGIHLSFVLNLPLELGGIVFIVPTMAAWYLGYRLFPTTRRAGQRCVTCGYDLRACFEPRCPECGTPFDPDVVKSKSPSPGSAQTTQTSD